MIYMREMNIFFNENLIFLFLFLFWMKGICFMKIFDIIFYEFPRFNFMTARKKSVLSVCLSLSTFVTEETITTVYSTSLYSIPSPTYINLYKPFCLKLIKVETRLGILKFGRWWLIILHYTNTVCLVTRCQRQLL